MLSLPGATGYDPVVRRRTRRIVARLRPWVLPAAVVVAALIVTARPGDPGQVDTMAPTVPSAPAGLVLLAVTPADRAVMDLVVAGSRVDVYAAGTPLGPEGADAPPARLVAGDVLVVGPGTGEAPGVASDDPGGGPGPGGGLGPVGLPGPAGGAPAALTLAVTDAEAAAIAARPGTGLTLAVRPP